MKVFFLFFHLLKIISSYDIYVTSATISFFGDYTTSSCLKKPTPCTGTLASPINDLYSAFITGVSAMKNPLIPQSEKEELNFYLKYSGTLPGHQINSWGIKKLASDGDPFKDYFGKITIQTYGAPANDPLGMAILAIRTDSFIFTVNKHLIIKYIALIGSDMNNEGKSCLKVFFPCCTDPTLLLNSVKKDTKCFLGFLTVNPIAVTYNGFFLLKGEKAKLEIINTGLAFFNSYDKHVSFIYSSALETEISINGFSVQEAYFSKSFITVEDSSKLNLNINTMEMKDLNPFSFYDQRNFLIQRFFNLRNVIGTFSLTLFSFQLTFSMPYSVFYFENTNLNISMSKLEIKQIGPINENNLFFYFIQVVNAAKINNISIEMLLIDTLNVNELSANTNLSIFLSNMNRSRLWVYGPNNNIVMNQLFMYKAWHDCIILFPFSINCNISIIDSVFGYNMAVFFKNGALNTRFIVKNVTFVYIVESLLFILTFDQNDDSKNIYEFDELRIIQGSAGAGIFFTSMGRLDLVCRNSIFANTTSTSGSHGYLAVLSSINNILFDNCTFFYSYSTATCAFANIMSPNTTLTIINSNINYMISLIVANFIIKNSTLKIENCTLNDFISIQSTFMLVMHSNVILRNIVFNRAESLEEGFIGIDRSNLIMQNCTFLNLKGDKFAFLSSSRTLISIDGLFISSAIFKKTFIDFASSVIELKNCLFENITEGTIINSIENNKMIISNIVFSKINIKKGGLIIFDLKNNASVINLTIKNIECIGKGNIISLEDNYNIININDALFSNINSDSDYFFYFSKLSTVLMNSITLEKCQSIGRGNIFYIILSELSLISLKMESVTSKSIIISSYFSKLNILNSIISDSSINLQVIYGENSDFNIENTNFSKNTLDSQSDSSILYLMNSNNKKFNLKNINFINDGINSEFLIVLKGIEDINIDNMTIISKNGQNLIKLQDCYNILMNFIDIKNNSIDEIIYLLGGSNIKQKKEFKFILQNSLIELNNISKSIIHSVDMNLISFFNISINRNKKIFNDDPFFNIQKSISKWELIKINFNENNDLFNTYLFYFLDSTSNTLETINVELNQIQLLNLQNSSVKINKLNSTNNIIMKFILGEISTIELTNSLFSGNNKFVKSVDQINLFKLDKTNLILNNIKIQNIQLPNLGINQYDIYVENSEYLKLTNIKFLNDYSIAIYAKNLSEVNIIDSSFEFSDLSMDSNKKFGGVLIENTENVIIESSDFINIGTKDSSSAFHFDNSVQELNKIANIKINKSNFKKNKAINGGGLTVSGLIDAKIENCNFENNEVFKKTEIELSGMGGSLYSKCLIKDECNLSIKNSIFGDNIAAAFGGGIFTQNYAINSLTENKFNNNTSIELGLKNNSNMSSPFYINVSEVVTESKLIKYSSENQTDILFINNFQPVDILFEVFDSNNLKCDFDSISIIKFSYYDVLNTESRYVQMDKGNIYFNKLQFEGNVNETLNIKLEVFQGKFKLLKNLTIIIRLCEIGEYFDSSLSTCVKCPFGSYSLKSPLISIDPAIQQMGSSICEKCPKNAECEGLKIVPNRNYWINSSNTTEIVQCPIVGTCIQQDLINFDNSIKCVEGYYGPLCVMCEVGYSKESLASKCMKCSWRSVSDYFLIIAKLLFILIFVTYQIYSVIFTKFQKVPKCTGILIKIIRDHFNQLFLIMTFTDIFNLDEGTLSFYQSTNDVITGSALNFDCLYENKNFSIFYFKIAITFISPFIMLVFVTIIFFIIFLLKKFIKKRPVHLKYFLKTAVISFIVICDTQYTQLLMSFLKLFQCVKLDSNSDQLYAQFNPEIQCYSQNHISNALFLGIPYLVIWIFGLPIVFFLILEIIKKKSHGGLSKVVTDSRKTHTLKLESLKKKGTKEEKKKNLPGVFENNLDSTLMISFLFYDYTPNRYYWTSIIMVWKSIMSILVIFIDREYLHLSLFAFYLVLIYIYANGEPYNNKASSFLIKYSLAANITTIVLSEFMFTKGSYKHEISIANLIIQLYFICFAIWLFIREFDYRSYYLKSLELFERRSKSKFSTIILKRLRNLDHYFKNIEGITEESPALTEAKSPGFGMFETESPVLITSPISINKPENVDLNENNLESQMNDNIKKDSIHEENNEIKLNVNSKDNNEFECEENKLDEPEIQSLKK